MAKIRVGLIGAGRMGRVYAHHLAYTVPDVTLVAVADNAPDAARVLAEQYGAEKAFTNYQDVLDRKDIDVVAIVTSTHTHVEIVKAAAAAGKQIFCEKPLALTVSGCDEAITVVKKAGVRLMIGFMRRFDPPHVKAKKMIDEGVIGRPVMYKSSGRDPKRTSLEFARRESSGGIILDMGIHDFDAARWLMGDEVIRVSTEGGCLVYPELKEVGDIDNAMINLKFSSGAIGNIDVTRNAVYGYDIRCEILGSEGSLMVGRLQHTPLLVLTRNGVTHDTLPYFMERFADAYEAELRTFITCIREDKPVPVTGEDARAATAIGAAATLSYDESRPVEVK